MKVRGLQPEPGTPQTVVNAVRRALIGRSSQEETAWIDRIELLRRFLLSSPDVLEIIDFGAGAGHRLDVGTRSELGTTIARTLGEMTLSSRSPRSAYLLFSLVRELRPDLVIELGSCVGISAAYQAAALELNGSGCLVTIEGAPVLAQRSRRTIEELGLDHRCTVIEGRFTDTLPSVLRDSRPVSMAFIDGHHVESSTTEYAEQILASAQSDAVLVFDDIHWSPGMDRAWETIVQDARYSLTIDLGTIGLAVRHEAGHARSRLTVAYG